MKKVFVSIAILSGIAAAVVTVSCSAEVSAPAAAPEKTKPVLLDMYFVDGNTSYKNEAARQVAARHFAAQNAARDAAPAESPVVLQFRDVMTGEIIAFDSAVTQYKVILPEKTAPYVRIHAVPSDGAVARFVDGSSEAFIPLEGSYTTIEVVDGSNDKTEYTIFYDREAPPGGSGPLTAFLREILISGGIKNITLEDGLFDNGTREYTVILPRELANHNFAVTAVPEYDGEVFYDKQQPMTLGSAGVTVLTIAVTKSKKNTGTYRIFFCYEGDGPNKNITVAGGYTGKLDILYRNFALVSARVLDTGAVLGIPEAETRSAEYIINAVLPESGVPIHVGRGIEEKFALTIGKDGKPALPAPGEDGVIPVNTIEDFQQINTNLAGKYLLKGNLDALGVEWVPVGTCKLNDGNGLIESGEAFTGEFDGGGFQIINLTISTHEEAGIGVFKAVGDGAAENVVVKNLNVSGMILATKPWTGGIAGSVTGAEIQNCVSGLVIESYNANTGGIAGGIRQSRIENSRNTGHITAAGNNAGGITGVARDSEITGCSNSGAIASSANNGGGFAGLALRSNVTRSFNTGAVTASSAAGGIAGHIQNGNIYGCANTGGVTAINGFAGGITGDATSFGESKVTVSGSKNTGAVTGGKSYIGGIAGYLIGSAYMTACYNTGTVTSEHNSEDSGGLAGGMSYGGGYYFSACYNAAKSGQADISLLGKKTNYMDSVLHIVSPCFFAGGEQARVFYDNADDLYDAGGKAAIVRFAAPVMGLAAGTGDWQTGTPEEHAAANDEGDPCKGQWWKTALTADAYPRLWWED